MINVDSTERHRNKITFCSEVYVVEFAELEGEAAEDELVEVCLAEADAELLCTANELGGGGPYGWPCLCSSSLLRCIIADRFARRLASYATMALSQLRATACLLFAARCCNCSCRLVRIGSTSPGWALTSDRDSSTAKSRKTVLFAKIMSVTELGVVVKSEEKAHLQLPLYTAHCMKIRSSSGSYAKAADDTAQEAAVEL